MGECWEEREGMRGGRGKEWVGNRGRMGEGRGRKGVCVGGKWRDGNGRRRGRNWVRGGLYRRGRGRKVKGKERGITEEFKEMEG